MIKDVVEYIDIKPDLQLLRSLFDQVHNKDSNEFGKTQWLSYSLQHNITGEPTGYEEVYEPILSVHKQVHPHIKKRDTGFNTSDSIEKMLFPHTDIDDHLEYPNYYNLVIPVIGKSYIEYFETKAEEVYLPENNAQGYPYYHEFKAQKEIGQGSEEFEKYLNERSLGRVEIDKPILIKTNIMHRVIVTEAPRCAWVTRWNNIPAEVDYQTFKKKVENIL